MSSTSRSGRFASSWVAAITATMACGRSRRRWAPATITASASASAGRQAGWRPPLMCCAISRRPSVRNFPSRSTAAPTPRRRLSARACRMPRTPTTPTPPSAGGSHLTTDDELLARDLAERAGQLLLDLRSKGGDPDVLRKAGDRLSHEFITAELAACRPADAVLSEEGADDKARLAANRVWIVDPLDGTREFGEAGREDWAVHVALWEGGTLTAGAVALPAQGRVLSTVDPPAIGQAPDTGQPLRLV